MSSTGAKGVDGSAQDQPHEVDRSVDESDDPSRFGGERTSATVSPRVGWDEDAEDMDALLSDAEKSDEENADEHHRDDVRD